MGQRDSRHHHANRRKKLETQSTSRGQKNIDLEEREVKWVEDGWTPANSADEKLTGDPIEQEQPRYLAFVNLEHDFLEETPFEFIEQILPDGKLAPNMVRRGASVFREEQFEFTYDLFNMNDPLIGGLAPERVALRRAMVLAHDRAQEIDIVRRKQAIPAQSPVPPGVVLIACGVNRVSLIRGGMPGPSSCTSIRQ